MVNTKVSLCGWELDNPVIPASGTFGYGYEFSELYDINILGTFSFKGTTLDARFGNPTPRIAETASGMLNAVGLQNPGVEKVISEELPKLKKVFNKKVMANVSGFSIDDYVKTCEKLDKEEQVGWLEVNVSCPNVKAGGHTFGQDPAVLAKVVSAVRAASKLPLIVKLAPNVPSIVPYVKACEDAGADALSMINTIPAMVIDTERRKCVLANRCGGLSGRGVHPAAVKLVYDAYRCTKLPILAMGGVYDAKDAIEFLLAGASAVAVGTAIFSDPGVVSEVYDGVVEYCRRHGFASVSALTGALED